MKYIPVKSCEDCPYNERCYNKFVKSKHKNIVDANFPVDNGECPLPNFPKSIKQYLEATSNDTI